MCRFRMLFRAIILMGWLFSYASREVSAFLLDHGFSGVPETALVHARHPSFTNTDYIIWKTGSFQEFVDTRESAGDYHFSTYSVEDVQRIGLLDIRLLNTDRNDSNILVLASSSHRLIPIDHGMILPDCCEISEQDIVWMSWPQAKQKWSHACLDFIRALDIDNDALVLEKYNLVGEKSVMLMKCATLLLKIGAEHGLTLFDIGEMLYRQELEQPSVFEGILSRVSQRFDAACGFKRWEGKGQSDEWGCAFVKSVEEEIESTVRKKTDMPITLDLADMSTTASSFCGSGPGSPMLEHMRSPMPERRFCKKHSMSWALLPSDD